MRKVANIMMLLNGIFSIILAVTMVITGVVFILMGTPLLDFSIQEIMNEAEAYIPEGISPEVLIAILRTTFIASGVIVALTAVPLGILANLSFKTRHEYTRGRYLAVIIMSAIFEIEFGIIGGIFGLIANRKAPKPQVEVIEAK